jgi:hypothetical protein
MGPGPLWGHWCGRPCLIGQDRAPGEEGTDPLAISTSAGLSPSYFVAWWHPPQGLLWGWPVTQWGSQGDAPSVSTTGFRRGAASFGLPIGPRPAKWLSVVTAKPRDPRPLLRQGLVPFPFENAPSGNVILPAFPIFLFEGRAATGLFRPEPRCAPVVFPVYTRMREARSCGFRFSD